MNQDDYDKLSELLERWAQRAVANGRPAEYARLCHEMEQRGTLYVLDAIIEVGAWEIEITLDPRSN